jgi:HAD superfamily hydrolase (TIGR01509 family)
MLSLIFDCDGVLVDSEKLSCASWLPVLARRGLYAELSEIEKFVGKSDQAVLEHFRTQTKRPLPDELVNEREREYFDLAAGRLRPFPGLLAALEALRGRDSRMAVASSGRPEKIRFNLSQAELSAFFDVICSVTQVRRGKPAPDLFIEAARQLGVRPDSCVVIEDSIFGIQAARAAEMTAIGFCSSYTAEQLRSAGAHHVFGSYADLLPLLERVGRSAA